MHEGHIGLLQHGVMNKSSSAREPGLVAALPPFVSRGDLERLDGSDDEQARQSVVFCNSDMRKQPARLFLG